MTNSRKNTNSWGDFTASNYKEAVNRFTGLIKSEMNDTDKAEFGLFGNGRLLLSTSSFGVFVRKKIGEGEKITDTEFQALGNDF